MRTYEITNELNGEKIRVSGITTRECQSKTARKIRNKGLIARVISRIGEK